MDLDTTTFDDVDSIFDTSIQQLNLSMISDRLDDFDYANKIDWFLTWAIENQHFHMWSYFIAMQQQNRQLKENDIDAEDDLGNSTAINNTIEEKDNVVKLVTKEISASLKNVPWKTIKLTADVKTLTKSKMQSIATSAKGNKNVKRQSLMTSKPSSKPC